MRKDMKLFKNKNEVSLLYKRTKGEKVLYAIIFLLFAAYALSMIVPFAWLLVNSLQNHIIYDINKANGSIFTLPKKLYFDNYIFSFQKLEANGSNIFAMFFNSVWYVAAYVGGSVLMSAFTGYALSKYKFKLGGMIYAIIIFSMTVPTTGTTGATFKLVNDILNIYDTPLYVILKHLNGTGLNFLIMYGFFRNVSWSYAEAGFIDGASHTKVFFEIMLPQALPAIGTLCIMSGITAWNEYMEVLLYMPSFPTIASGMYSLSRTLPRLGNTTGYFAALVISLMPILIVFSIFSDVIMKNFSVGGLKG